MITVHHESWVATLEISIPETWKKSNFYQLVKNHFWGVCQNDYNFTEGGYGEMITVLHRGGYAQMITILHRGGVSRDPKKWLRNMCTTPYEKECLSIGPCRVFSTTCWRASVVRIFYSSSPIFWFIQFTLVLIMPLPGLWMIYHYFQFFNILIHSINFGLETVGTDWRLFIGTVIESEYFVSLTVQLSFHF